jgi:hypothetical protein
VFVGNGGNPAQDGGVEQYSVAGGTAATSSTPATASIPPTTDRPAPAPDPDLGASTTSASPTVPAPAGMTTATAGWLTRVCTARGDINATTIPAGTNYPNLTAAQDAYVLLFARKASIAQQAAADLEKRLPVVIADGRVDADANAAAMRNLAQILDEGAQSLNELRPQTIQELDAAAGTINTRANAAPPIDLAGLTAEERAYVELLPGCPNLG